MKSMIARVVCLCMILKLGMVACPSINGITFSPTGPVPIGTSVSATVDISKPDGCSINTYDWTGDFSGSDATSDETILDMAGTYDAAVSINWSCDDGDTGDDCTEASIDSYMVDYVESDTGAILQGEGKNIGFTASIYPEGLTEIEGSIQWEILINNTGEYTNWGTGLSKKLSDSTLGKFKVRARAGDNDTWAASDPVYVVKITIDKADIETGVDYKLEPTGYNIQGPSSVSVSYNGGSETTLTEDSALGAGSYNSGYDVDNLPLQEFNETNVSWTLGLSATELTKKITYKFKVLGKMKQSQYLYCKEAQCSGAKETAYFASFKNNSWTLDEIQLRPVFVDNVNRNGSGYRDIFPKDTIGLQKAWDYKTYRRNHPEITSPDITKVFALGVSPGDCGIGVGATVAVSGSTELDCVRNSVYISGFGKKKVSDHGSFNNPMQLDNFCNWTAAQCIANGYSPSILCGSAEGFPNLTEELRMVIRIIP
ncbi:MAG: hypothetical protein A2231_09815 [Candidatus Firestonebacteria bacterium RIFOXYA2_FULL_40_8]|nr:MAG: hypothetical protein A2231_09815 [Candidatus Firestonebacteria bacterium RIFOXYA2_FULL_40_8]